MDKGEKQSVDSLKRILVVQLLQHNVRHMSCRGFHLCTQPKLLKAIKSSTKYMWAQPQVLQESSVSISVPRVGEITSVLLRNFAF